MAITVVKDLREGFSLERANGIDRLSTRYNIHGLSQGGVAGNIEAMADENVEGEGEPHWQATRLFCKRISPTMLPIQDEKESGKWKTQLALSFEGQSTESGQPDSAEAAQISVGSQVVMGETTNDYLGAVLELKYRNVNNYYDDQFDDKTSTFQHPQGIIVPKLMTDSRIGFTRKELSDPSDKSDFFTGKVNEAGWLVREDDSARTWMCMAILGVSTDNGSTYDVAYDFQKAKERLIGGLLIKGWDPEITYQLPDGQIPIDIDHANQGGLAHKGAQIYSEADFNELNLKVT